MIYDIMIYKYMHTYHEIYLDNINRFDGWVIDINIFCKKRGPWVTSFSQSTLNKIRTLENVHHIINTRLNTQQYIRIISQLQHKCNLEQYSNLCVISHYICNLVKIYFLSLTNLVKCSYSSLLVKTLNIPLNTFGDEDKKNR